MSVPVPAPHARLTIDAAALAANWRAFAAAAAPAVCAAAIKADGYGLGARDVLAILHAAGCRHFYVAHWQEVPPLLPLPEGVTLAVLHGVGAIDMAAALALPAVPVLSTPAQVALWRQTGRPAELMADTGINRLGVAPGDVADIIASLPVTVLHSHLACAEEAGSPMNERQRQAFAALAAATPGPVHALANSAGVALGRDYCFGMVRPGIGLYGGGVAPGPAPLAPVVGLSARIVQLRDVPAGASVGYGATFVARRPSRIATVALGYADGFPRALSGRAHAMVGGVACAGAGRVSMDLSAFDVTDAPPLAEGDWLDIVFDVAATAAAAGLAQYELLTGLGARYARVIR